MTPILTVALTFGGVAALAVSVFLVFDAFEMRRVRKAIAKREAQKREEEELRRFREARAAEGRFDPTADVITLVLGWKK